MAKSVDQMTVKELITELVLQNEEHDLDCEEGGPNDRCPAHLAKELYEHIKKVEEAFKRIGGVPEDEWDLEELSENLEPADMVRVIYAIGVALRPSSV